MSYPPIDPSLLPTEGVEHSQFLAQPAGHLPDPLSQPQSNPFVILDIDMSTTIDTVQALLSMDFTDTRAAWLHLATSMFTDMRNGIRNSMHHSISKFQDLTLAEQANLDSLRLAIVAFDVFLSNCQSNPDKWTTCHGCIQTYRLPIDEASWDANLIACNQMIQAARETIVNGKVRDATNLIDNWVTRERIAAHNAAINNLVSSNPSTFARQFITNNQVVEWSRRIRKAMIDYLNSMLIEDAACTLPLTTHDCLMVECQAKLDQAESDTCTEAKHLYDAELAHRQAEAYADAKRDFESWRDNVHIPMCQAEEEAFRAGKLRELDAAKHLMTTQAEAVKEAACLAIARSVTTPSKLSESCCMACQKRHADPTKTSHSVSHASSPTPSLQAADKMPTKADFTGGKQATFISQPSTEESVKDLSKMSPVLATGQTTKDSMWASPNVPAVQGAASALAPGESRLPEMELVLEPDSLAPVDTALHPAPTAMAQEIDQPANPPTMTTYASHKRAISSQLVPPSSVAPPSDMEQMLRHLLQLVMAPIQATVTDVASRITEIKRDRAWYPEQDNNSLCLYNDHLLPHQEPPADCFGRLWGRTEDEFPGFSHLTAPPAKDDDSHMDDADQRLENEDAILNSALPSEQRLNFNKAYEVHLFFRETAATVFSQSNISPEGWRSLSANDFEYDCSEMWHDFAHQTGASLGPLPPPLHIATPFVIYC